MSAETSARADTHTRRGAAALAATSREPQRDAALLLCHVLGKDRSWLLAHPEHRLLAEQSAQYDALLVRRAKHEPMQYILGEQEFYGLRFKVTPDVLIPRPETEHLVEAVLERLPRDRSVRIADVGTGSGCIAVALAHALPLAKIDALDLSLPALQIARENARTHAVDKRIGFHQSDLLDAVAGEQFECIVSNPPYIRTGEVLETQVAHWEPHAALFAGMDGMDAYRRLVPQAIACLQPEGLLALEIGYGQQAAINALLEQESQWQRAEFIPDLQGTPRVALVRTRSWRT